MVIEGDDASPEAVRPSVDLLERMNPGIEFIRPDIADQEATRAAIDAADSTLFGSTSGPSARALLYLRWGKQTYANVRPCTYFPGARSPLAAPEGIDFVIVRENLEDLYLGIEGELGDLAGLNLTSRRARTPLADLAPGRFAIKAITEAGSERVIRFAFQLARRRGARRRVTLACKYNMLPRTDGLFPDIEFETFIIDDFCCRMIRDPQRLDVVVMPNLYGDILSDGAAGLVGGLGMAPSGCYGDTYAYFESAHGTAPDIAGRHIINPTATLLSAAMMLEYLDFDDAASRLRHAIAATYADGRVRTPDQGGQASTSDFCHAVASRLG